jgi:hypothetical protein
MTTTLSGFDFSGSAELLQNCCDPGPLTASVVSLRSVQVFVTMCVILVSSAIPVNVPVL